MTPEINPTSASVLDCADLKKFGVTAATESWRQEYTTRNVRFAVIEPGAVDPEMFSHQQQHVQDRDAQALADIEKLHPEDIAEAIAFIATCPRRRGGRSWPAVLGQVYLVSVPI